MPTAPYAAVEAGDEQDLRGGASRGGAAGGVHRGLTLGVELERDDHAGEHDVVPDEEEGQCH